MRTDGAFERADLVVRPGYAEDLGAVADVYLRTRAAAAPQMPPLVHPVPAVRAWILSWDLDLVDLWVAEDGGDLAGFAAVTATWLDHLYVSPEHAGRGVGSALLALVQSIRPDGFGLWVFESNRSARRFYRAHGLQEVERTDGSANEEGAPDVRMEWPGVGS